MLASLNDSVLLMLVGMLNFLGAILLAQARAADDEVFLPALPEPTPRTQTEAIQT